MTRFYDVGGRQFPSVTSVLQIIAKPGLLSWYGKLGTTEAERVKRESADLGTRVHAVCEHLALAAMHRDSCDTFLATENDPLLIRYAESFVGWIAANVAEVLAVEEQVAHLGEGFAGTLDLCVRLKDAPGIPTLVDLKTSNGDGVYPEFRLQTAAYVMALWETRDILCPRRLIVQLPSGSPGTLHVHELPRDAFRRDWDGFRHALGLWRWRQETQQSSRPLVGNGRTS